MLRTNIQAFAEPQGPADPEPSGNTESGAKTFTEDYVSALRGEAAGHRTRAKSYEGALRTVLGLKENEDLGDLNERITAYQQAQQERQDAAVKAANDRLVHAAVQGLEGYDAKLLGKVIDLSHVTVSEDGTVSGLKEAAEAAAQEYPAVKKTPPPFSRGTKGPDHSLATGKDRANEALRKFFGKD